MEGEDVAMMPPKKRGAAAVSAGEESAATLLDVLPGSTPCDWTHLYVC